MHCELCDKEHEGKYGSGRFCGKVCARAFSTKAKRAEINEKVSKTLLNHPSKSKGTTGKKHSEESKTKIAGSLRERRAQRLALLTPEEIESREKIRKARNVARVMAYRARKYKATPPTADRKLINKIYEMCPAGYHVDHIHSLSTGGEHHQDNLQYLPGPENCRKCASRDYDKSLAIDWRTIVTL